MTKRDLFRSFLYCTKYKLGGTLKYGVSSCSRKQKRLDPINEYVLSFKGKDLPRLAQQATIYSSNQYKNTAAAMILIFRIEICINIY